MDSYPITKWNGGKVQFISESIIHLLRGQVYTIDGLKFFTCGGAESIDKDERIPGISWWERELPSQKEYEEGLRNLKKHNWNVDYVITHECSELTFKEMQKRISGLIEFENDLRNYLNIIEEKVSFNTWYFGHYHIDGKLNNQHILVYEKMHRIA